MTVTKNNRQSTPAASPMLDIVSNIVSQVSRMKAEGFDLQTTRRELDKLGVSSGRAILHIALQEAGFAPRTVTLKQTPTVAPKGKTVATVATPETVATTFKAKKFVQTNPKLAAFIYGVFSGKERLGTVAFRTAEQANAASELAFTWVNTQTVKQLEKNIGKIDATVPANKVLLAVLKACITWKIQHA